MHRRYNALIKFVVLAVFGLALVLTSSRSLADQADLKSIEISPNLVLHYTDTGTGPPLILVHGGISDYRMWSEQVARFSKHYRVISYSRRYNFGNSNPPIDGYSAKVDAEDLVALIKALKLQKVYIVAHSYGAFGTLFLLRDHPELVAAAVLAEPPAVPLLKDYPPSQLVGHEMELDIKYKLTGPITAAIQAGDNDGAMRAFYDYVAGPGFYDLLPSDVRQQQLDNAREWDVMLTKGTFWPEINADDVRGIKTPVLLMAGSETNPFLMMIDETLDRLLPNHDSVIIEGSSHPMFTTHPDESDKAVSDFLARHIPS